MPLVYQQNINEVTKLAVWHIDEQEDFFLQQVPLQREITHQHKRLQHLAGRFLLRELFPRFPLQLIALADTKKPFLPNEAFHFSISHCGDYAAAIVSEQNRVGVDIELITGKVALIKDKFLDASEQQIITGVAAAASSEIILPLTWAWSTKETIFKWYGEGKVDFRQHMHIVRMDAKSNEMTASCIFSKHKQISVQVHGLCFNNLVLTWLHT